MGLRKEKAAYFQTQLRSDLNVQMSAAFPFSRGAPYPSPHSIHRRPPLSHPDMNKPAALASQESSRIFRTFLLATLEAFFLSLPGLDFIYLYTILFQSFLSDSIHTDTLYNCIGGYIQERAAYR